MISLEEWRKRNPYDRLNTEGQSVFDWKEQTYRRWRQDALDSARRYAEGDLTDLHYAVVYLINILDREFDHS